MENKNIINDWLSKNPNPEIDKEVEKEAKELAENNNNTAKETRTKIDGLRNQINTIQEQIVEIQNGCSHKEILVDYHWRAGSCESAYVCEHCDKFIEYKSQRDLPNGFKTIFTVNTPNPTIY